MTRRRALLLAAWGWGCRKSRTPDPGLLLPGGVAEVWHRQELREVSMPAAAAPVVSGPVRHLYRAAYQGPGKLDVTVYELTSSAAGLDATERWRPEADTIFFYSGNYFVVVKWQRAQRQALTAFVRALEKRLGEAGER